ncbi:endo alpha-1,4 polygalactosaminidase [Dactylosporangium matsuzakiense]|uniref:Endo alpha-1,4 polygalactosaminidase n=1 Tax=Dactylosporangium matsuzakiense TaxID=53360 RepID=A0A9W6KE11_9ACTN|nr:endo alpha-1,4 polygalactosaminidase [Dactylosporangium matsuzakiense]UWZ45081.1 endo alpha-1,4 polygalactosaminidase [Dactylosporangium matsuzakiense]GLK98983.1 endo alpha-1,4 polygalactosaminidase [Dactylosporangium matsuzakiense]
MRRLLACVLATAAVLLAAAPADAAAGWWRPAVGLSWQMQFSGKLDTSVNAQVYDIDGADSAGTQVAALHKAGRKVVCYVDAGSYEDWRADAAKFPAAVRGKALDGWPGEQWLDVRNWTVLQPILSARFSDCKAKGFDAVDPDNMDGYANDSGFPLTAADQLTFNRRVADLAHGLGLAVGLKNDLEQVRALQPSFDFAVNESCAQYKECGMLAPFITAGKPVFHVEYSAARCPTAAGLKFSNIRKKMALDAFRAAC